MTDPQTAKSISSNVHNKRAIAGDKAGAGNMKRTKINQQPVQQSPQYLQ